jgi:hypothetical protein
MTRVNIIFPPTSKLRRIRIYDLNYVRISHVSQACYRFNPPYFLYLITPKVLWRTSFRNFLQLLLLHFPHVKIVSSISRLDHVRNDRIKEIMDLDKTFIDRVEEKQLVWYGHLQRMSEERWPKKILEWTPHGRRRRGRP